MQFDLQFTRGYIGHPYWVEREKVINITKKSGTNRAKSEATRLSSLHQYLDSIEMSLEDYERLVTDADRPFYTAQAVDNLTFGEFPCGDHQPDEITIPPLQIFGCLVQASKAAAAAIRVVKPEQVRNAFTVAPIYTGKVTPDGVWERFAVLEESNQRSFRSNEFIKDFVGRLTLTFDPEMGDPTRVLPFLKFAGREIGLGASRKLGWGRFTVTEV
jgi:hypothetical protein